MSSEVGRQDASASRRLPIRGSGSSSEVMMYEEFLVWRHMCTPHSTLVANTDGQTSHFSCFDGFALQLCSFNWFSVGNI